MSKTWAKDSLGALVDVESAIGELICTTLSLPLESGRNVFGTARKVEQDKSVDKLLAHCDGVASEGMRTTLVATASDLLSAVPALREVVRKRLGFVVHVVCPKGLSDAMLLTDFGWGVLVAGSAAESRDFAYVARRAAEDSGTPFFVFHEPKNKEPLEPPDASFCDAFVGAPSSRLHRMTDPGHPFHAEVSDRVFAERVPFALQSAMREFELSTSRPCDLCEYHPVSGAAVVLVGLGEMGDTLLEGVDRLRAAGEDVGALKLNALRPFPGAVVVRALARALAVSVIELYDAPLAQSNLLTRELKAAFADALTWAPEYPSIGRIPHVLSGVAYPGFEASELGAVVRNMLANERSHRTFSLGGESTLPPLAGSTDPRRPQPGFSVRVFSRTSAEADANADFSTMLVSSALGVRVRATVRELDPKEARGHAFDLIASASRPRGSQPSDSIQILLVPDAEMLIQGNPLLRLARSGIVVMAAASSAPEIIWKQVPAYMRAIVFDRNARLFGWNPTNTGAGEDGSHRAVTQAAVLLAAASTLLGANLDGSKVREALSTLVPTGEGGRSSGHSGHVDAGVHAFGSLVEVPRELIERDEASVLLGRRDPRGSSPPGAT